ncbi:MAG: response regulator transcription factor [Oscillochloridaceae bacterium]|nr:response regulator transcription factor [Chloroflexaceae bacterium]MDW8388699.1 response regulator transcription factor [Oscillochloridaceae bacterium]
MRQILIVDDEADLVWAVGQALRQEGYTLRVAYDGNEALELCRYIMPDLIILDVSMPHMDGLTLCRALRRDPGLADVPVLFLTGRDMIEDRLRGFEVGGDDYLVKPFDLRELKARVHALLRRTARSAPNLAETGVLRVGALSLNLQTRTVQIDDEVRQLTPAEFELLNFLMRHPDEVYSSEQLLRHVWGYAPDAAEPGLVRWHVMNLRNKIERDPARPAYLCTVPRHGYILRNGLSEQPAKAQGNQAAAR